VLSVRALSAGLALCLAALPLAPAEHVHDSTTADGHHQVLAHTHAEGHHFEVHQDHRNPSLDDEESVILTLDSVFVVPHGYVVYTPALSSVQAILEPPAVHRVPATPFVERLIHGPPRAPTVLRGPPPSSLL
jgi:hypothetical protein